MARKTKMNHITTPYLLRQVNPQNKQLLDEFVEYCRSTQKSETTIAGYISDINIAFVWALQFNSNMFFVDWKKKHIVKYQNWLLYTNENSPARVRRLKAALSSLANYVENVCEDEYPTFRNIINKIENPKNKTVRDKTVWTDEELDNLLEKLVLLSKYEQACYLALGMYSGRRKAELCRFKVSDFDDSHLVCDGALYKSSPIKTKGAGGGKMLECYTLANKFRPYLEKWMCERKLKGIDSEWLFPKNSDPSTHIGISTANSWANTFDRLTDKPFYTHSLRHRFTTALSEEGIPDGVIQEIIGWESGDMVKLYVDTNKDDQIAKFFKGDKIIAPKQTGLDEL